MKKSKPVRTYSLSEDTIEKLERLAKKEKRKLSAVIELAVDEYWSAQNGRRYAEIG